MPTTVLVIDDDDDTRATLRTLLEESGYTVMEAVDGVSALELLHCAGNGCVVMFDYRMPRMNGEALLALAEREDLLAHRHAFICVTASPHSLPPVLDGLLARYDVPLVAKPFEMDDLLAVVRKAEQRLALLPAWSPPAD